jgi:hypothetical protein
VKALHRAGIDNSTYHRPVGDSPRYYKDYTRILNTLNTSMRQASVLGKNDPVACG